MNGLRLAQRHLCTVAFVLGLGSLACMAQAQTPPRTDVPVGSVNAQTAPNWEQLRPAEREALQPLAQLWPSMSALHKRKWIILSRNFDQLGSEEKATLQGRMRDWAALTPQQRSIARLNFADAKQLPQDEKKAKWEAYQALSEAEKKRLADQHPKPKLGAAPALRPTPPEKLASPPPATSNKPMPRIATDQVDRGTLRPNPQATAAAPSNLNPPGGPETTTPTE